MDTSKPSLLNYVPTQPRANGSGWYTFNAVCCHHRGHRPDNKQRGGIKIFGYTQVYHCFNCDFKCGFTLGHGLSGKTRQFLTWCGLDPDQILEINFSSIRLRDEVDIEWFTQRITYEPRELPECELLDKSNSAHKPYIEYLRGRGIDPQQYPFMVNPSSPSVSEREKIIIPTTHEGVIVGHIARQLNAKPKYLNNFPSGYIFGIDLQRPHWKVSIIVEGVFDAISIDGIAVLTNNITDRHAQILSRLPTEKIYVPDHDAPGMRCVDRALELGYKVSIPNWSPDIKDVNDAVARWGKTAVIASILQAATDSKIKIKLQRKIYESV